ncbi:hypothetical protein Q4543_10760 [Salipiger sp. 1_MG-2023]|nr:hypothetical protein [Salipiger sp. 1_MG-2023]
MALAVRRGERDTIPLLKDWHGGAKLPWRPNWLINGAKPPRGARLLREQILPSGCWKAMLSRAGC